jgi:hypothetical protein
VNLFCRGINFAEFSADGIPFPTLTFKEGKAECIQEIEMTAVTRRITIAMRDMRRDSAQQAKRVLIVMLNLNLKLTVLRAVIMVLPMEITQHLKVPRIAPITVVKREAFHTAD